MVKTDNGKSVHDEAQGYEDAELVDDVGLDSGGFDYDHDSKHVTGTEEVSADRSGYGLRERNYEHGHFGQFGPDEQVFRVFTEFFDAPAGELEDGKKVATDGGVPNGSPFYRAEDEEMLSQDQDADRPTMDEVTHVHSDYEDTGGAPL